LNFSLINFVYNFKFIFVQKLKGGIRLVNTIKEKNLRALKESPPRLGLPSLAITFWFLEIEGSIPVRSLTLSRSWIWFVFRDFFIHTSQAPFNFIFYKNLLFFKIELLSFEGEDLSPDRNALITKSILKEGKGKYDCPPEHGKVRGFLIFIFYYKFLFKFIFVEKLEKARFVLLN